MHIHLNHKIPNSSLTCGDLSHICQYSRTNSWDDVRWMLHSMRFSIAILHWSKRIVLLIFLPITDNITNWTWILTYSTYLRTLWNQCCISNCNSIHLNQNNMYMPPTWLEFEHLCIHLHVHPGDLRETCRKNVSIINISRSLLIHKFQILFTFIYKYLHSVARNLSQMIKYGIYHNAQWLINLIFIYSFVSFLMKILGRRREK